MNLQNNDHNQIITRPLPVKLFIEQTKITLPRLALQHYVQRFEKNSGSHHNDRLFVRASNKVGSSSSLKNCNSKVNEERNQSLLQLDQKTCLLAFQQIQPNEPMQNHYKASKSNALKLALWTKDPACQPD